MYEVDRIRVERFRQLRAEILGSKEHLIVGIDVAKEKHNAFFGTATGKTLLKRLVFGNTIEGFNKLLSFVEAVKVNHGLSKEVFGLEPTANYHKPLGEYLIKCGLEVVLVSGSAVKKNRELLDGRWDKHDTKDSANVADLLSQGKCLYYDYPCIHRATHKLFCIVIVRQVQAVQDRCFWGEPCKSPSVKINHLGKKIVMSMGSG